MSGWRRHTEAAQHRVRGEPVPADLLDYEPPRVVVIDHRHNQILCSWCSGPVSLQGGYLSPEPDDADTALLAFACRDCGAEFAVIFNPTADGGTTAEITPSGKTAER